MPRVEDRNPPSDRVMTLPNALTLFRLLMVPVVVGLLLAEADGIAVAVFVAAALTDFLDGRIARRQGPTRLGQLLDPVADRLMLSSSAIVLAIRGLLPVWAVAILVGRDVLALLGSFLVRGKMRVNVVGKAATAVLMVSVGIVIFSPGALGETIFYAGCVLSLAAAALYAVGFYLLADRGEIP
ncbi:MAG TPA: CDP-alcohol phosphatidyltransferase family protein [Rubrobacteraceae bacterium]|nr:CDP-alcohol phosphatidyltransferase family protein [Rubrobacteraceae bacterium]